LVWIASENGLTKTVRLLLENGASVDYPDPYGYTALFYGEKIQHLIFIFILNCNS
jgi:ankyrin repeat protein